MSAIHEFLSTAPALVFMILFGIPFVLAGIFIAAGIWSRRNAQALKSVSPVKVSKLTDGYRLAEGRVADEGAITAPLTGRKCAWYEVKVEEDVETRDSDGDLQYNWRTVRQEESDRPIRIVEGGAACFVTPQGASVFPTDWSEWSGPQMTPADRDPKRHPGDKVPGGSGRLEVHSDPSRRFRYLERYIYPGDPVFALGQVSTKAAGQFTLAKPAERKPFLVSTRSAETILAESTTATRGGLLMGGVFAVVAVAVLAMRFS